MTNCHNLSVECNSSIRSHFTLLVGDKLVEHSGVFLCRSQDDEVIKMAAVGGKEIDVNDPHDLMTT